MSYKKDTYVRIRMTSEEKERLSIYAEKTGLTYTEIILRGIDTYISQRDKKARLLLHKDT